MFLLFYTDPGSGMMLLQLLLASLAGGIYYFRNFFTRIFGRKAKGDLVQAAQPNSTGSPSDDAS